MHYVVDGEARTAGHYVVDGVARAVCSCLPKCSKASWMAELISLAIWPWTSAPKSASPTIRGLHSFPFPLNLGLLSTFPLNLSLPCPPYDPN